MATASDLCKELPPLGGFTVGVTAHRRAEEQIELLRRQGARVVHAPVVRTAPLGDERRLRAATERVIADPPAVVLATTGIGVRGWVAAAEAWGLDGELLAALGRGTVHARGPKAQAALLQAGVAVGRREPTERLDAMVRAVVDGGLSAGSHVAVQLYGIEVPWAVRALEAAGARVTAIPVYTCEALPLSPSLERLVTDAAAGALAAITFTSPAAVDALLAAAAQLDEGERLRRAFGTDLLAACVGPCTAERAMAAGVPVGCAPEVGRLGLMVRALAGTVRSRHVHLDAGGRELVVQGALVRTRDGAAALSNGEHELLRALLRRPGAVVPRERDGNALESAVRRLRRQVEPLGLRVAARPRRGYLLEAGLLRCPCG